MLKPSQKILRKEIKKDPLLETFEKIESGFEKNKKTLMNVLIFFMAVIIGGSIFKNNQNEIELESKSAFNAAIVAYSNLDYDNAKFQLESISTNYEGTESEILANYYLGKIAYIENDFTNSEAYLNKFLNKTENETFVCGAIKQLVDISFQNQNFSKSLKVISMSKSFDLNSIADLELKILETSIFFKLNDFNSARANIDKIKLIKNLPSHIKSKTDEFIGMF
tara:strand:- start:133 stop:801 length:669 start_codon:yes stop_codon:yes gene_type:complete